MSNFQLMNGDNTLLRRSQKFVAAPGKILFASGSFFFFIIQLST